jgi:hypothetical protein
MPPFARFCFRVGATLAAGIALLHVALPFAEPGAYAYFGAPQLAVAERAGARWPDVLALLTGLAYSLGVWCAWRALRGAARN